MSTRALFKFYDAATRVVVYKHHDGYPSGARAALESALDYAWRLPRFEPDEFAAAFIAANKPKPTIIRAPSRPDKHDREHRQYVAGGGVRVMRPETQLESTDCEYLYEITQAPNSFLIVYAHLRLFGEERQRLLFTGPLHKFIEWTYTSEARPDAFAA